MSEADTSLRVSEIPAGGAPPLLPFMNVCYSLETICPSEPDLLMPLLISVSAIFTSIKELDFQAVTNPTV